MERWMVVKGFPDYEVSDQGRVRSKDRLIEVRRKDGTRFRKQRGQPIAPNVKENGYLTARLHRDGKSFQRYIHRLVARAFVGKPPFKGAEVMHADDVRDNNVWTNLSWGSKQDNMEDMKTKKRQARGSRQGHAVLTEADVRSIARLLKRGLPCSAIAKGFGVTPHNIRHIRNGTSWAHVTGF